MLNYLQKRSKKCLLCWTTCAIKIALLPEKELFIETAGFIHEFILLLVNLFPIQTA